MAFKRSIKMWEGFINYVSTLWDCVGVFDSLHFNLFPNGGFKLYIVTQQANYALAKNPKTRNGVREGEEIFHQKRKYLFYIHEKPREEKKVLSTRKWKMFESCCPPSPLTVSSRCWWPFFATLLQLMVKILLQIYRLTRFQEVLKFIFRHTWKVLQLWTKLSSIKHFDGNTSTTNKLSIAFKCRVIYCLLRFSLISEMYFT